MSYKLKRVLIAGANTDTTPGATVAIIPGIDVLIANNNACG